MNRFERSWSLFKSSLLVIIRNKQLLVFPIFISAATAVILLFFLAPAALWPTGYSYFSAEHWHALGQTFFIKTGAHGGPHQFVYSPIAIAYLAFLYFISMLTATFFNVAFYNEILAALSGQPVSLSRGLKFACSRWKSILMWALVAGLVGLLIKALERRRIVGDIVARVIGVTWSIASVFVIPIIVREEPTVNPFSMLKKSAGILKNAWGEGLIAYVGMGAINFIFIASSVVVLVGTATLSAKLHNSWLIAIVAAWWVVMTLLWSYLMNVAGLVYKGALYLYAAEGVVTEPYNQDLLNSAWRHKKNNISQLGI